MPPPGPHPGTLHRYAKRLVAFEHASSTSTTTPQHTILFAAGLTDGLLTIPYPHILSTQLPPNWTLAEVLLSSSYKGWATGSLERDARELGECVKYFKALRPGGKIVLMGHSTGCQDIMEYLVGSGCEGRSSVDGVVLQGGVSDREAWEHMLSDSTAKADLAHIIATAKAMIDAGKGKEMMSRAGNTVAAQLGGPMSAYRTYSLLAPGGDDDYFSSDLLDTQLQSTFGKIPASTPVCFLLGSEDPYVPPQIDKADLLARWTRIIRAAGGVVDDVDGGVIPGAHHNLDGDAEDVVGDLVKRVCGFVAGLEKGNEWSGSGSRL